MHRPAITKRVSLEGVYDGWTKEAYAIVMPISYAGKIEINNYGEAGKTQSELLEFELKIAKEHFLNGKAFFLSNSGDSILEDLSGEDLDSMVDLTQRLFVAINGGTVDPKGLPIGTETSPTKTPSIEP
ncbi:hypothetical protein [Cryobacterium sp. GrIS_2_6]|uniref:hypothetical protein n=1 Tax=Cryobacterium sp. GrIS_2_6 TaxID=3162785 RepID=UPI002E0CD670|nr:hypothetical protein [Cryobacterium psychrotolerans]